MTRPDPIVQAINALADFVVQFDRAYHAGASAGLYEEALSALNGGQVGPDPVCRPDRAEIARDAFEAVFLASLQSQTPFPFGYFGVAPRTVCTPELQSACPFAGFQDVPRVVAALQSVLGSSSSPILAYYQSSDDAADVGLTQSGGQGA